MKIMKAILAVIACIIAGCFTIPLWFLARTAEIFLEVERKIQNRIANIMGWIADWSELSDD